MVRLSEESPQKVAAMIDNDSGILELHEQHAGSSLINALAVASPLSVANLLELVESLLPLATMIVGLPEAICDSILQNLKGKHLTDLLRLMQCTKEEGELQIYSPGVPEEVELEALELWNSTARDSDSRSTAEAGAGQTIRPNVQDTAATRTDRPGHLSKPAAADRQQRPVAAAAGTAKSAGKAATANPAQRMQKMSTVVPKPRASRPVIRDSDSCQTKPQVRPRPAQGARCWQRTRSAGSSESEEDTYCPQDSEEEAYADEDKADEDEGDGRVQSESESDPVKLPPSKRRKEKGKQRAT
ncbi:hypothetical protein FS837_000869 [Tulasnella sp. UAMH 9824]|nr:hypothetical protein FS837_000869 [Tulasnella sp. UAMH 9824]